MKNIAFTLAALLAVGIALAPADAAAQIRRRPPVAQRDWAVRPLVIRTERESNAFRAWFERSSSRRDWNLKQNVQNLDEALERLRNRASDRQPGVGRPELERAIGYARVVDRKIDRNRQGRYTNREWNDLRRTINDLARLYNVRGV